uniref:Uncharacterized protein n=1 Tax=Lactuca sativa TaxID=4236 RepID=A0A9R1WRH6_LACSA|nr:hypothetical protein LSAT_V11C100033030 [Lactuca sativa]
MASWRIHANMEEIDVHSRYERKYIWGKRNYVDLLDVDTFSVHDIDDIMEKLGFTGNVDMENISNHDSFGTNMDMESEHDTSSNDECYLVDEDNMIHDVDVDMHDFHMNIDHNVQWVGGATTTTTPESSSDEGNMKHPKNTV